MTTSIRLGVRRVLVGLMAAVALAGVALSSPQAAHAASGTTYARYSTEDNTWARIVWYEGSSIHSNGRKLLTASCSYSCPDQGWAEMVMESGDNFRLWARSGSAEGHSFYSGVAKFRFCVLNEHCTGWVTRSNAP